MLSEIGLHAYPHIACMQSALELLRSWCSIGGWFDERKATFKTIADTQLVGCTTVNPIKKS